MTGLTWRSNAGSPESDRRRSQGAFPRGRWGAVSRPAPRITDGQVHVWLDPTPERLWPPREIPPQREPALTVPELTSRMAEAGVDRCLLVPPTWEGPRNDYVLAAAAAQPHRFAALCRVNAADPADVEKLADWRDWTGMVGLRLSVNRGDTQRQLQDAMAAGFFATAEKHGIPLSLYAPRLHSDIRRLAERFPELRITVDHLAVDSAEAPLNEAVAPLLDLADLPNIAVKASALPCFVREPFPYPSITRAVRTLVETFGAQRVFWGSDLSRLPCPYGDLVEVFVNHTPGLTGEDRALVLGGALSAWLRWPDEASHAPGT